MATLTTPNQTVEITWTDAPIIRMTARKAIEVCGLHLNEGEIFFLVRSVSQENRYHCVRWNYDRICWQCSCGAGCKSHSHVKVVSAYSKQNPYSVTHALGCPKVVKAAIAEAERIVSKPIVKAKPDTMKAPLNGNRGFCLMR